MSIDPLISLLEELFIHRRDTYAIQKRKGEDSIYLRQKEPLTVDVLRKHVAGELTTGTYQIDQNTVKWMCTDHDGKDKTELKGQVTAVRQALLDRDVSESAMLIEDSGLKGYHLWTFFEEPVPAPFAYKLGRLAVSDVRLDGRVEIFPKQKNLSANEYGNLVKVPAGIHQVSGKRSEFLTWPEYKPSEAGALAALSAVRPWRVPEDNPLLKEELAGEKKEETAPLLSDDRPCWIKMSRAEEIKEGTRHDVAFALMRHLRDKKVGKNAVKEFMREWWRHLPQPPETVVRRPWANIESAIDDVFSEKGTERYGVGCLTIVTNWPHLCSKECPLFEQLGKKKKEKRKQSTFAIKKDGKPVAELQVERKDPQKLFVRVIEIETREVLYPTSVWPDNFWLSEWRRGKLAKILSKKCGISNDDATEQVDKFAAAITIRGVPQPEPTKPEVADESPEVKESAEGWTKNPGLLSRLDRVIHEEKELVGETKNASLTFFSMHSAKTDEPVNLRWSGRAAVGKSTIVTRVVDLFPPEMVIVRMGLTKKSIFYLPEAEEVDELTRKLNLDGKILVILEEENSQEFLDEIKPLLSHDMRRLSYSFVEEKQTKTVYLEGWPAYVGITTQSKRDETTDSRTLLGSPDMGKVKYRAVISRDADRKSRPWEYRKGKNVEVMRQVIRALPKTKVWNPFANVVRKHFPHTKARMMRDFQKLMGLIDSVTLFHYYQRPRVKINGEEHVVTFPIDVKIAFKCAESSLSETLHGLERDVQRFYNFLVETDDSLKDNDRPAEWTYKDLQRLYKEHFGEGVGRTTLRTRYIEKLEDLGMIDVDDSGKPFKHSVCSSELAPLTDSTKILSEVESEETKQDLVEKTLASAGGCVETLYVPGKTGDNLTLEDVVLCLYAHPPDANVAEVLERSFEQDYAVSDLNHDSVNRANLVREKKLKKGILNFLTRERARLNEGERESTWSKGQFLLTLGQLTGEEVAWGAVEEVSEGLDWVEVVEIPDKATTRLLIHWDGVEKRGKEGVKPENGGAKKKRKLSQADLMEQLGELHKRTGGEGLTVEGFTTMAVANLRNECEGRLREAVHQMAEHGVPFKTLGGAQVEAEKKEEKLPPSSTGALPPIQEIVKVFEPLKGGGKISRGILADLLGVTREGLKKILVMPQVSGMIIDRGGIVEGK